MKPSAAAVARIWSTALAFAAAVRASAALFVLPPNPKSAAALLLLPHRKFRSRKVDVERKRGAGYRSSGSRERQALFFIAAEVLYLRSGVYSERMAKEKLSITLPF